MGWLGNATPRPLYSRQIPNEEQVGKACEAVCTGTENLALHQVSNPILSSPYRVGAPAKLFLQPPDRKYEVQPQNMKIQLLCQQAKTQSPDPTDMMKIQLEPPFRRFAPQTKGHN